MKRKVVHIVFSGLGGTADYILNLIKGDQDAFFDHRIIFFGVEQLAPNLKDYAEEVCSEVHFIHKSQGIDRSALLILRKTLESIDPVAVTLHVNSLILHKGKWLPNGVQLIFVEHQANHLKTKKEWIWSVLAQQRANAVVSLRPEYLKILKKKLLFGYRKSKNMIIETGLSLEEYSTIDPSKEPVKIGMIGRFTPIKDYETLLAAFVALDFPNAELHLAGEGETLDLLREKYPQNSIHFHGYIAQKEIPVFLETLTIYVQASMGETSSIAVMQARAIGLPLVVSDVEGLNTVCDSENAILVPAKSITSMKIALEKLILYPELRREYGNTSRQYALEHLDNKKMFDGYKGLIQ